MVTSPSIKSFSSKFESPTFWPSPAFSITIALKVATAAHPLRLLLPESLCGHQFRPMPRLLHDRQIDHCGEHAEQNRKPPDRTIGAGAVEHDAAEPDADD